VDDIDLESLQVGGIRRGKACAQQTLASHGRYVKSLPVREGEKDYEIAPDATLRAALIRNAKGCSSFSVTSNDLRKKLYKRPKSTLIVFIVDSSDSMGDDGTYARIKAAKGAVLAILSKAHQKRHRVSMVTFREASAEILLHPTTSFNRAERSLRALPTGGTTPFADGLLKAWRIVKTERLKDPGVRPLLVIISDGEANVPHDPACGLTEVMDELFAIAGGIGLDGISSLVIDTRPLHKPSTAMSQIAAAIGGTYHHISRLKAAGMVQAVVNF
jgi:magnesium chelatase subunit D